MEEFHITLPSNTITDTFKNNTASDYEIALPTPIDFGGSTFEVALAEIFFPHTWYNIPEELRTVAFQWVHGGEHGTSKRSKDRKIAHGYYGTAEELVNAIDLLKPSEFKGKIFVNPVNNLVHISMAGWQALWMEKRLAALLGFRKSLTDNQPLVHERESYLVFDHTKTLKKKVYRAGNMCDPDPTMQAVYVYCSVIKENLVGAQNLRLLRLVPTLGQHGTMIHQSFDTPLYHEVAYDRINSIRLTLTNDQGEPIHFTAGKTLCRLHFRRKYPPIM